MPVERIDPETFLQLSLTHPVLDVRSPSEYKHAHIPGAVSLPLFTDDQRAEIGTAYVQVNPHTAVDIGLSYFSKRMLDLEKETEKFLNQNPEFPGEKILLVYCWRGGMRSDAVAWLLNLYGYKMYVLQGGYKAFRRWTTGIFGNKYSLKIVGGFTGSGKTCVLKELRKKGKNIIDLEGLANHKGSAFGSLGQEQQPSHEMFENMLATELWKIEKKPGIHTDESPEIWMEDESIHIGKVGIPKIFWEQMRSSPVYFLKIPFEKRLAEIVCQYGNFEKDKISDCIFKIQKRLGGLQTKQAVQFVSDNKIDDAFSILLKYYDRMYAASLENRVGISHQIHEINCDEVLASNAGKLLTVNK